MKLIKSLIRHLYGNHPVLLLAWVIFAVATFVISTSWFASIFQAQGLVIETKLSILITLTLLLLLATVMGLARNRKKAYTGLRFAPDSAGLDQDELGLNAVASNYARSIKDTKDYVSILGIFGEMGSGKSSLTRMIIESLEEKSILYSYISLTETNETQDFEKLFQERWFEAIKRHYAKIEFVSHLPLMASILRESKNGFIAELVALLSSYVIGLFPTAAVVWDRNLGGGAPRFSSRRVAGFFGYIPKFEENHFVIVIDELERAQTAEVYRVIEIIERFKYEGRSGLPMPIIFVLCISQADLGEVIDKSDSEKGVLIRKFIYEDPKSITMRLFIPPPTVSQMQNLIHKHFIQVVKEGNFPDSQGISPKEIYSIGNPHFSFPDEERKALQYALGLFLNETPRVLVRAMNSLLFFLSIFTPEDRKLGLPIRMADLVVLEYVKIRFPYLIDFFRKTIVYVRSHSEYGFTVENINAHSYMEEIKKQKIGSIFEWIERETKVKVPDSSRELVHDIFGIIAHRWLDVISSNTVSDSTRNAYWIARSTSDPEKMSDWLAFSREAPGARSGYRLSRELHDKHLQHGSKVLKTAANDELISYSRFLYESNIGDSKLLLDVLKEITTRLMAKSGAKSRIEPEKAGPDQDTLYNDAIYRLIFLVMAVIEIETTKNGVSDTLKETWNLLRSVLYAKNVQSDSKLQILNSFANDERGSGGIDSRLKRALEALQGRGFDAEIKTTIKHVFDEIQERYIDGKKDIYNNELNPFFVMYQFWSGDKENLREIEKIRTAAKRNLANNVEMLKVYWSKLPIEEGWTTYDDVLRSRSSSVHFFKENLGNSRVYMPFEDLVSITKESETSNTELLAKLKFWGSSEVLNAPEFQKLLELKDDLTLKAVLIRNKLYELPDALKKETKPDADEKASE